MKIESREYDDGCARGIKILVNDELVISYKEEIDEPIDITSYNR